MNRILSWKVDVGVYAYIYLPNSTTHISSRITEDSPMWSDIINVVSTWDEPTYKSHFEKMADEIKQRFGVILSYQEDFFNFADENSTNGTNIVILAGEDGQGGNTNGIIGGGTGDAAAVYDAFLAAIDAKLAAARADIEAENTAVKEFLQAQITNTISEAQKKIEETKEELDATKEEMTGRLDDATDALNKAAELFELGDGNIDGEAMMQLYRQKDQEVISIMDDWFEAIAKFCYNIDNIINPECICIGGGNSQDPLFVEMIQTKIDDIFTKAYLFRKPQIKSCQYQNDVENGECSIYRRIKNTGEESTETAIMFYECGSIKVPAIDNKVWHKTFKGNVIDGKKNGLGVELNKFTLYVGEFKDDVHHGNGVLYEVSPSFDIDKDYSKLPIISSGEFKNGKFLGDDLL